MIEKTIFTAKTVNVIKGTLKNGRVIAITEISFGKECEDTFVEQAYLVDTNGSVTDIECTEDELTEALEVCGIEIQERWSEKQVCDAEWLRESDEDR